MRGLDHDVCIVGVVNFNSCIKGLLGLSADRVQGLDAEHTHIHAQICINKTEIAKTLFFKNI